MGVERAMKTIAHRVASYKDNNSRIADKKWAIQTSSGRFPQQKVSDAKFLDRLRPPTPDAQ
jgi:hypothetical protein